MKALKPEYAEIEHLCRAEKMKIYRARYEASAKGKQRYKNYTSTSPVFKAAQRRFKQSPKGKECAHRYKTGLVGREAVRRYHNSPNGIETEYRRPVNDYTRYLARERQRRYAARQRERRGE